MNYKNSKIGAGRKGLTLTEVAVVLLIIGVVLTGLWAAVDGVYRNSKVSTVNKQLLDIVSGVRSLYGMSRGTMMEMTMAGTAGATSLALAGVVPKDMTDRSTSPPKVVHVWGGDVTVDAARVSVDGDSFTIGLVDVPPTACAELIMRTTGVTRDGGIVAAGTTTTSYNKTQMPVGISAATTACQAVKNKVIFTFMLKT